jgi:phage shock protein C
MISKFGKGQGMKRLYRSRKNKMIAGVCGGIAEHFEVDPVLVRLIAVLFLFAGGAAFIAYILGIIIIPLQPFEGSASSEMDQSNISTSALSGSANHIGSLIIGVILILFGIHFLLPRIPGFGYYYWRFWDMGWNFFWPSVLIIIGLLVILRGSHK